MKIKTSLIIISFILSISVLSVSAERYWPFGYHKPFVDVYYFDYNSMWQNPLNSGFYSWRNTDTLIWTSKSQSSKNRIYAKNSARNDYGWTDVIEKDGKKLLQFNITLNSRTISRDATNFNKWVQSIIAHEVGHTIWLDDNPPVKSKNLSLMRRDRDRDKIIKATSYDEESVNGKYK